MQTYTGGHVTETKLLNQDHKWYPLFKKNHWWDTWTRVRVYELNNNNNKRNEKEILKEKQENNDEMEKKWRINEMKAKLNRNEKEMSEEKDRKKQWWNG